MSETRSFEGALAELYRRVPLGMRLGLAPMNDACARAGRPEAALSVVHIAGTNGKGSTSAMVEAIARASGLRTGLYTSPHLCRFAERIRVAGEPIDDGTLAGVLLEAETIGAELSFFETATLAAFLAFRAANVDLAVIEVGIGGRLDATNVIEGPKCAALTSVAFDHQDKLGDTLTAIAREKAAIAKRDVPFVLGELPAEAAEAALGVARDAGARIVLAPPLAEDVEVGLGGAHQRRNAAVASAIAGELGISDETIRAGLRGAFWPGRLERIEVKHGPFAGHWLLDGAHNPDGVTALVRTVGRSAAAVVFGALDDKGWPAMLEVLAGLEAPRFYAKPGGRTPAEPAAIATRLPGRPMASLREALASAREAADGGEVVVCGSLYLVGEARALLLGLPTDPVVAL